MKPIVAVTGVTGFVGQALSKDLHARGYSVRGTVRSSASLQSEIVAVGDIGPETDWASALLDVECLFHCAARAHAMYETEADVLKAYRTVNVEGTKRLAEQAAALGVRRFVFLSSIKVNGERTTGSNCFGHQDAARPEDPYGISKWEAEQALHAVAARTGLEVVIVRPPLVYGPGVKGNFARLLGLVRRGLPLPLGAVDNRRSMVGMDNLADLLVHCAEHPRAAGQTFLVSDGDDLSTPELLRRMATIMRRSVRLFPVPVPLLRLTGRAIRRLNEVDRLIGSLRVDISHTREILGWSPPLSVNEGLRKMVMGP